MKKKVDVGMIRLNLVVDDDLTVEIEPVNGNEEVSVLTLNGRKTGRIWFGEDGDLLIRLTDCDELSVVYNQREVTNPCKKALVLNNQTTLVVSRYDIVITTHEDRDPLVPRLERKLRNWDRKVFSQFALLWL